MVRSGTILACLLILAAAAALRHHALGRADLWGDELLYLRMSHGGLSFGQVIDEHVSSYDYIGHLPSAALITNTGLRIQGIDSKSSIPPYAARLPSVVAGCLSLVLLALWIQTLHRDRLLTLTALLCGSLSYIHIYYSREAYHYPGQVFYAMCVLLFFTHLIQPTKRTAGRTCIIFLAFTLSSAALAFSHPTSILLPVLLGIVGVYTAIRTDRKNGWLYSSFAVSALLTAWIFLGIGSGQKQAASNPGRAWGLMLPELADLMEIYTFGPGILRLLLGVAALTAGTVWLARNSDRRFSALLVVGPAIVLLVQLAGRKHLYLPRYYLLAWPFVIWALAACFRWILNFLQPRIRPIGLAALGVALGANLATGLAKLYPVKIKRDGEATLSAGLDEYLSPGTICLWDGGHALRFIPDMLPTEKPHVFGALPGVNRDAYTQGWVEQAMTQLCNAFPLVAFMEWDDFAAAQSDRSGQAVRDHLIATFGNHKVVDDEARRRLAWSGWLPDQIPNYRSDYGEIQQTKLDKAALHLYYRTAGDCTDPVLPIFGPGEWNATIAQNALPLLLGRAKSTFTLVANGDESPGQPIRLRLAVVGLQLGTITVDAGSQRILRVPVQQQGQVKTGDLIIDPPFPREVRFFFSKAPSAAAESAPSGAPYALVSLRSDHGPLEP